MELLFLNMGTAELIILIFAMLLPFTLAVIAMIDILRSSFQDPLNKVIWAVIVLFAPVFGALAYLFWGRRKHRVLGRQSE